MTTCSVTPPSWVQYGTYIEENIENGVFKDWWSLEFRNNWNIDNSDTTRNHIFAVRNDNSEDLLTPANTFISGPFEFDVTFQVQAVHITSPEILVYKASDDSLLCKISVEAGATLRWTTAGFQDLTTAAYTNDDRYRVRIKRSSGTITADWYDDFISADGTGSYTWNTSTIWTNTVSESEDVYIKLAGTFNMGFSQFRLQAESGFPCNTTPNSAANIIYANKCYHLGFNENQGIGWDDVTDGDWIWISNPAQAETVIDSAGYRRLIAMHKETGLWYMLNVYDGPAGSGFIWRNRDRVDPNVDNSGTDIGAIIRFREYMGDMQHYTLNHSETHIHIRPRLADNRSGNLALEYPSEGFETLSVSIQTGELYKSLDRDQIPAVGEQFTVYGFGSPTGGPFDFTGGEMETAKGSALVNGDVFSITNNVSGSEAISYVGVADYNNLGLMVGQQFDASLYADGVETPVATASDIPHDREIVFDRKAPGHTLQVALTLLKSDWRIVNFEQYFTVYDVPQFPKKNSRRNKMQSTVHEESLSTPYVWISRNHSRPLINRSTGRLATGTVSSTTVGPDGENTGITVSAP